MVFHKIRSLSMTELFVREIKRMILMGELKIGDRLPPERELAQKMGLKLTVVNSGIAQLQQMGFLKAAPRQAVYVEDYLTNGNIRTMMEMIDFTDHVIDEDLLELIQEPEEVEQDGQKYLTGMTYSDVEVLLDHYVTILSYIRIGH